MNYEHDSRPMLSRYHVKAKSPILSSIILLLFHSHPSFLVLIHGLHRCPYSWLRSGVTNRRPLQIITDKNPGRDGAKNGPSVPNVQRRGVLLFLTIHKSIWKPGGQTSNSPNTHVTHRRQVAFKRCLKPDRCSLLWSTPGLRDQTANRMKIRHSEGRWKRETPSAGWNVIHRKKPFMCNILNTRTRNSEQNPAISKRRRGHASRLNFSFPILSVSVEQLINKAWNSWTWGNNGLILGPRPSLKARSILLLSFPVIRLSASL